MLNDVKIGENMTETKGNVQLSVSFLNQSEVTYRWTYVDENGVPAMSKDVFLSYNHGYLECFLDNWQLYRIVGRPILTKEEAVAIALNASKTFSWEVLEPNNSTSTISEFNIKVVCDATLSYLNGEDSSSARDNDPFALYPSWHITLGFDKVYGGSVTGLTAIIWGDNGAVSNIGPLGISADQPSPDNGQPKIESQKSSFLPPVQVLAACAGVILIMIFGCKVLFFSNRGRNAHRAKFYAILIALLLSF